MESYSKKDIVDSILLLSWSWKTTTDMIAKSDRLEDRTYTVEETRLLFIWIINKWEEFDKVFNEYIIDTTLNKQEALIELSEIDISTDSINQKIDEAEDFWTMVRVLESLNNNFIKEKNDWALDHVVDISMVIGHLFETIKKDPSQILSANNNDIITLFKLIFEIKDHAWVAVTLPLETISFVMIKLMTNGKSENKSSLLRTIMEIDSNWALKWSFASIVNLVESSSDHVNKLLWKAWVVTWLANSLLKWK